MTPKNKNIDNRIKVMVICLKDENHSIQAIKHFLKWILKLIHIDYEPTKDEIISNHFCIPTECIHKYVNVLNYEEFDTCDKFIYDLCTEANEEEALATEQPRQWLPSTLRLFETLVVLANGENCGHIFVGIIARLSLSFFLAIHQIRVNYVQFLQNEIHPSFEQKRKEFILNQICNNFYVHVTNGILDSNLHELIVSKLIPIIEEDFQIIYVSDKKCLNFYLTSLTVQNKITNLACIESLLKLFNKQPLEIKSVIFKFLLTDGMQHFFPNFTSNSSKSIVLKTFELLKICITFPDILDEWSTDSVRTLFTKIFDKNLNIRTTAASLYIDILRKKHLTENEILLEILEFFLILGKLEFLPTYIHTLWDLTPSLKKFDFFFGIFCGRYEDICKVFAAHFILAVCKRMVEEIKLYSNEINHLVEVLGKSFKDILKSSITSFEILLNLFKIIPSSFLRTRHTDLKQIVMSEMYGILEDVRISRLVMYYVTDLLTIFKMPTTSLQYIFESNQKEFINIHNLWSITNNFQTTDAQAKKLRDVLAKLAVFSNQKLFRPSNHLVTILKESLVESGEYSKFIPRSYEIEGYAIEVYSNSLQSTLLEILRDEHYEPIDLNEYLEDVQHFLNKLIDCINVEKTEADIFFASKCISALFKLYSVIQPKNNYVPSLQLNTMSIKLNVGTYGIIIFAVIHYVFKASKALKSNNEFENIQYQRDILESLNIFHANYYSIPTLGVWKVVSYYGDTNVFQKELYELLKILYHYESPNDPPKFRFNRVLPSAIYNLKNISGYPKTFPKRLKEFKEFIIAEAKADANMVQISLILNILETHISILPVVEINSENNRLEMLPLLNLLLPEKVDVLVIKQIKSFIFRLRGNFLTIPEQRSLREFEILLKLC